ncbi:uncharacterized protein LOC143041412 isoform X1 [Oratosquilla oratoria]|uniref:uncharacterized protein LOC143041412 isoform X1 n=1 Tax=Oratosquilla oratoria TaxID=337810 RepID=UPI003F75DE1C
MQSAQGSRESIEESSSQVQTAPLMDVATIVPRMRRRRTENWLEQETKELIWIWKKHSLVLRNSKRNSHVYQSITEDLQQVSCRNPPRSKQEVHFKISNLTKIWRNERSKMDATLIPSTWPFFNMISEVMAIPYINHSAEGEEHCTASVKMDPEESRVMSILANERLKASPVSESCPSPDYYDSLLIPEVSVEEPSTSYSSSSDEICLPPQVLSNGHQDPQVCQDRSTRKRSISEAVLEIEKCKLEEMRETNKMIKANNETLEVIMKQQLELSRENLILQKQLVQVLAQYSQR